MGIGVDLGDLGIATSAPVTPQEVPVAPARDFEALIPGEPLAQVLFQVWSGRDVVVVPSPPGAGKTTLLARLVAQLHARGTMNMTVITPTRRSAFDIAERIGRVVGLSKSGNPQVMVRMTLKPGEQVSEFVGNPSSRQSLSQASRIAVTTIASAAIKPPITDLLIVDEAYQAVFSDVARAAEEAPQIVLVGDPGQIGPIVTADTSAWDGQSRAPHMRAPEVFVQDADAFVVPLPSTYRVGQDTVDVIAPLYDFPFDSRRPDRYVVAPDGERMPELRTLTCTFDGEFDVDALSVVAREALSMIGREYVTTRHDGTTEVRTLTGADIAVGVARSGQEAAITAIFQRNGGEALAITVGTADRLQGGQWPAFVGLDPLAGSAEANSFRVAPGRLCVLMSRHEAHMTWVHDGRWGDMLRAADTGDARRGAAVRHALMRKAG